MRKLFVFLALLCSSPAWAAISYTALLSASCTATSSAGTACTLTTSNTLGTDVVVGLSWKSTSQSLSKVVGNVPSARFFIYAQQKNGTGTASAIVVCRDCAALTSITPTFSGSTDYVLNAGQYSGVAWMGITQVCPLLNGSAGTCAANAGTQPGITIATGDANNWLVTETASLGSDGIPKPNTGNLRLAGSSGTSSNNVAGGLIDNTQASAGSLSASDTITSSAWTATGLELRTTAPQTYIWPDCDQTHPCLIHHKATVGLGASSDTLTSPFYVRVQPSLANNLLVFIATYPRADTFTMSDNNGNTWATGASTTDSADGTATVVKYVCGAGAGVSTIEPSLSGTMSSNDIVQFSYYEISGIAASSCGDGGSSANGISGTMNPGSYTTNSNGDLLLTFAIDAENYENGYQSGWAMGDDLSALVFENPFDNFLSMISVQAAASSSTNPTMYGNAMDLGSQDPRWNILSQAFTASSGAGTQPPAGQAWVVREGMFHSSPASTLGWMPFPTNGNAIVLQSSNAESDNSIVGISDNQGATYVVNPIADSTEDPQQYASCLGNAATNKDRGIAWKTGSPYPMPLDFYDIAGAKNSGGTGCIGSEANHNEAMQAGTTNSNIVGDITISPTLNGSAYSVIVTTSYFGQGPPSGPCISGGITPPTCTGDMTPFVFASIWAKGMSDGSHWDNGDPYGYWYTNSTSKFSVDYLMQNDTGGSAYDGAAIEILGQPGSQAQEAQLTSVAVAPTNSSVAAGATKQFTATGTYSDGSKQDISSAAAWSSSTGTVAAINSTGMATGSCAGSTTITATMSGQSNSTTLAVTGLGSTTTVVSSSANPSQSGQSVTFTAGVTSPCGVPTGTVQFVIDGANYGSPVTLSSGMASTSASLATGGHTIVGTYSGGGSFANSTSSPYSQTVGSSNKTNPSLSVANSPVTYNGSAQAAIVSSSVTGTVSNVMYSGSSTVPTAPGTYSVTANFTPSDTTDYNSLTGASAGNFVITKATPAIALSSSPNPSSSRSSVTFTATLPSTATGTVKFMNGNNSLGKGTVVSGTATLTTSTLRRGTYSITASYGGDTNYSGATSGVLTQRVNR